MISNDQGSKLCHMVIKIGFIFARLILRHVTIYHNHSLGLMTKTKGCKVAGQKKDPGFTSHAPKNAKECERMNTHTPK